MANRKGLNDFYCSYKTSSTGRWMVGLSRAKTIVWDLSKPLTAEGTGPLHGIQGAAQTHVIASDRWLVVHDEDGRLYFADLNTENKPYATEFFRLQEPHTPGPLMRAAENRLFVLDRTRKTVHFWAVAQFERAGLRR